MAKQEFWEMTNFSHRLPKEENMRQKMPSELENIQNGRTLCKHEISNYEVVCVCVRVKSSLVIIMTPFMKATSSRVQVFFSFALHDRECLILFCGFAGRSSLVLLACKCLIMFFLFHCSHVQNFPSRSWMPDISLLQPVQIFFARQYRILLHFFGVMGSFFFRTEWF